MEGTLEPQLMMDLAARNHVALPWPDVAAAAEARAHFQGLEVCVCAREYRLFLVVGFVSAVVRGMHRRRLMKMR